MKEKDYAYMVQSGRSMDMHVESQKKEVARETSIKTMIEDGKYYDVSKQEIEKRIKEKFNILQYDADKMIKEYY